MRALSLTLSTAALLVLTVAHCVTCDECQVYYLNQPVNYLTCNPHHFGLKLECIIYHRSAKNYDINWYRIPIGVERANPELVNTYKLTSNIMYNIPDRGQIISSRFHINPLNREHTGIYWCQIILRNVDSSLNTSFKPSSAFVLHSPEEYFTFPPCSDENLSQQQSKCATTGVNIEPPSLPSVPSIDNSVSVPPIQIVTTPSTNEHYNNNNHNNNNSSSSSTSDSDLSDLPPWAYAVIAGGGVISLIIMSTILCILLVFCQALQKYKAKAPSKVMSIPDSSATHGTQRQSRPPLPRRRSDVLSSNLPYHNSATKQESTAGNYDQIHPPPSTDCLATTASNFLAARFISSKAHVATTVLALSDHRETLRSNRGTFSRCSSASTAENDDHIYQTIYPRCIGRDETYETASREVPVSTSPRPLGLLVQEESLSLAKPKPPPPRLWNSPKSTACSRTQKILSSEVSSSSTSGIATMETTRGTSPASVVNVNQSEACCINTTTSQYQSLSPEMKDYISLYNTPQATSLTSLNH